MTLLNMFSIGGVGVLQVLSRRDYEVVPASPSEARYGAIFLFFGLLLLAGWAVYAFSRGRMG